MKRWIFGFLCGLAVVSALFFFFKGGSQGGGEYSFPEPSATATPTPVPEPSPERAAVEPYPLPEDDEILRPPASGSEVPQGTRRLSVQEAASAQLIRYEASGTGASSGPSMLISVTNISDSPIDVFVAPGTVLLPSGGSAQQMLAWGIIAVGTDENSPPQRATSIYLPDANPRLAIIEAYCLNFDLPNPERTDAYLVSQRPALAAASVVYAAKRENLSVSSTQVAVWKDQDDHITQKEIEHKFEASQEDFDKAFELVKRVRETRKQRNS